MKKSILLSLVLVTSLCLPLLATAQSPNAGIFPTLQALPEEVLNSPWGVSSGYGRSVKGDNSLTYEIITDQLATNIDGTGFSTGPIIGADQLRAPHINIQESLSGGWQFSATQHPFSFVGKSFVTNIVTTEQVYELVATPKISTAPIGAITGMAITVDPYPKGLWGFHTKVLGAYENRAGQGPFNGNYWVVGPALSHDF